MRSYNEVWIRGTNDMNNTLLALLRSGYDVRVRLDKESENLSGVPSYLLSFVDPEFSGVRFEAVNEDDELYVEGEDE